MKKKTYISPGAMRRSRRRLAQHLQGTEKSSPIADRIQSRPAKKASRLKQVTLLAAALFISGHSFADDSNQGHEAAANRPAIHGNGDGHIDYSSLDSQAGGLLDTYGISDSTRLRVGTARRGPLNFNQKLARALAEGNVSVNAVGFSSNEDWVRQYFDEVERNKGPIKPLEGGAMLELKFKYD